MKTKIGVGAIVALMLLFAVLAVFSAVNFLQAPQPVAKVLGVATLGIVTVGLWTLWRELRFGIMMERLGRTLAAEGGLPADDLPRSPGGRIDRTAADAQFEAFRSEAEAAPQDWRSWYRLSLGYDASGDRSRARKAMRDAIRLYPS
jgi:cytochrome c-type biogenesis protein CcmH/NrfG